MKNKELYGDLKYPWNEARLNKEEMEFLWQAISEANESHNMSKGLAGNISKSERLFDKDDWFFNSTLLPLAETYFYSKWNNYYKYHIEKTKPLPEFVMSAIWVNYQKQYEFNPIHKHTGLYSFVVFMKIPTHWKEQHELPISANSNSPVASDFQFVFYNEHHPDHITHTIPLGPEDAGKVLFFPSNLHHQVYPFYGTEEERITISGNIDFKHTEKIPNHSTNLAVRLTETEDPEEIKELWQNFKNISET